MPPPHVIVTRPEAEARVWCEALAARHCSVDALPLLTIAPVRHPDALAALSAARALAPACAALMFVSGNAVQGFFESNQPDVGVGRLFRAIKNEAFGSDLRPRLWATGPGTQRALLGLGFPAASIDAPAADSGQFDSEALWARVRHQVQPGDRVVLVRGGGGDAQPVGRNWLAQQLQGQGVKVIQVVAYERRPPVWSAAQTAVATAALSDGSWWLFSSSEGVQHLRHLLPKAEFSAGCAVATHPRIAAAARALGWGVVCESRPTVADVVASIESRHVPRG